MKERVTDRKTERKREICKKPETKNMEINVLGCFPNVTNAIGDINFSTLATETFLFRLISCLNFRYIFPLLTLVSKYNVCRSIYRFERSTVAKNPWRGNCTHWVHGPWVVKMLIMGCPLLDF